MSRLEFLRRMKPDVMEANWAKAFIAQGIHSARISCCLEFQPTDSKKAYLTRPGFPNDTSILAGIFVSRRINSLGKDVVESRKSAQDARIDKVNHLKKLLEIILDGCS